MPGRRLSQGAAKLLHPPWVTGSAALALFDHPGHGQDQCIANGLGIPGLIAKVAFNS